MTTIQEVEARRAARKAELAAAYEAQRLTDLERLDALEAERGDANVRALDVEFTPGITTLVVVRCPGRDEIKRFHDTIRQKGADPIAATEQVGRVCILYPTGALRDALLEARPALVTQAGNAAIALAGAKAADEGKG